MSGRWLFTVTAAFVFAYLSIAGILPIDRVMEILLIVIYAYFSKPRPAQDNDNNEDNEDNIPEDNTKNKK